MAKELKIVKKSNGVSIYKILNDWYLKVGDKVYQHTQIVSDQNEQAVLFKVEDVKCGFLCKNGEIEDVFVFDTLMKNKPLFTFK